MLKIEPKMHLYIRMTYRGLIKFNKLYSINYSTIPIIAKYKYEEVN